MIRHAPAAVAFPVDPLPVAVIEPSLPALLVPPRFPPAARRSIGGPGHNDGRSRTPRHSRPPAKPLTQWLFVGPHRRPSGGTGQPRLSMASVILSTEDGGRGFPVPPSAPPYQSLGQASSRMTTQPLTIGGGAEHGPLLSGEHERIRPWSVNETA